MKMNSSAKPKTATEMTKCLLLVVYGCCWKWWTYWGRLEGGRIEMSDLQVCYQELEDLLRVGYWC